MSARELDRAAERMLTRWEQASIAWQGAGEIMRAIPFEHRGVEVTAVYHRIGRRAKRRRLAYLRLKDAHDTARRNEGGAA